MQEESALLPQQRMSGINPRIPRSSAIDDCGGDMSALVEMADL